VAQKKKIWKKKLAIEKRCFDQESSCEKTKGSVEKKYHSHQGEKKQKSYWGGKGGRGNAGKKGGGTRNTSEEMGSLRQENRVKGGGSYQRKITNANPPGVARGRENVLADQGNLGEVWGGKKDPQRGTIQRKRSSKER